MNNSYIRKGPRLVTIISIPILLAVIGFIGWTTFVGSGAGWTTVNTDLYSVRIPDGWTVNYDVASSTVVDADCASCLAYKPGRSAKASVGAPAVVSQKQHNPFFISSLVQETEADFFRHYDKVGTVPAVNATATKYSKKITETREMGFMPGNTLYSYSITSGSNKIFIHYVAFSDNANEQAVVDRLVSTFKIN